MQIHSIHEHGGSGVLVSCETSLSKGLPTMVLVGFAGKSLDESKERVRSAFSSSNLALPKRRITVNVSPSDIPKDGAHYDLAIAVSILAEADMIQKQKLDKVLVFGELGLDGSIKPVRGILGKLISGLKVGFNTFIIPKGNLQQAALLDSISVLAVDNLKQVYEALTHTNDDTFIAPPKQALSEVKPAQDVVDFSEIIGQAQAKRALEIAVSGGHNVLLNGPPGVGKSMLAKALPGVMPPPSKEEIITITHLHSLNGPAMVELVTTRPFRSPHHSSSDVSIIGGGQKPKPGEVSLAHGGVLFLDELPEFRRGTIESLRQPLEDGIVTIARARDSVTYPAQFMLVGTKNPCPCGYYGSTKPCVCSPIELERYQKKLSGPIMDRIDIHVTVDNVAHETLLKKQNDQEKSATIRDRILHTRQKQRSRFKTDKKFNAHMNNRDVKRLATIEPEAKQFFDAAADKLDVSARSYMKLVKVAQTIADTEDSESITKAHFAEALQYRPQQS